MPFVVFLMLYLNIQFTLCYNKIRASQ